MAYSIGEIISQTRQNRSMTQEEFASRLGVTAQAVSKWERGLGMPDITLVEGICRILDLNANELLNISHTAPITENSDVEMQRQIKKHLMAEPLMLEIGTGLVTAVTEGLKTDAVARARKDLAAETGYLMPLVRIIDNENLKEREIRIIIYDEVVYQSDEAEQEDVYAWMIGRIQQVCRTNYEKILNKQLVKSMVDTVKELYPGIADGVIPEQISYLTLERRLKKQISERGNIRDFIHIIEDLEWEMQ